MESPWREEAFGEHGVNRVTDAGDQLQRCAERGADEGNEIGGQPGR